MRLELLLDCPGYLPFDHLPTLKGAFHRWAGHDPALHDGLSLYSLSWLRGSQLGRGGLRFPNGAAWSISAHEPGILRTVLAAILAAPELPDYGLRVTDATWREVPEFKAGSHTFRLLSPVLVKQARPGQVAAHLLHDDPVADELLTASLRHKLRQAGFDDTGASVAFDQSYPKPKVKLFKYKQVQCRANVCPVVVTGSAEQLGFAWSVGVGHSTGIGCGALE